MASYERVRVKLPGSRRRTVLLEIVRDDARGLAGYAVNPDGERTVDQQGREHLYIGFHADILKRTPMRMNLHYGELEPK